jgi:hypothetical protein
VRRAHAWALTAVLVCAGGLHAQTADTAAVNAVRVYECACAAEGGQLWGISLCGPVVIVEPQSRAAVANRPDPAGAFERSGDVYTGTLPDGMLLGNTAFEWMGVRWAMVLSPLPQSQAERLALLGHESFHRLQPELGLPMRDPANVHLAERDGRVWLRLELRALATALRTRGMESRAHLSDAMLFRAQRHALFPGADTLEAALELHEGLAEYTGIMLAAAAGEGYSPGVAERDARVADAVERFERQSSFVRSLGYGTGPALDILLDRHRPGWREELPQGRSLAALLEVAAGGEVVVAGTLGQRASAYDHSGIAVEEDAHVADAAARVARYRQALVDGPVLVLRHRQWRGSFNPDEVVPLGASGNVYLTGTFEADWGRLVVTDGALFSPDFSSITVAAPAAAPRGGDVRGPGWSLKLAPGWRLVPSGSGSYTAMPPEM